MEFFRCEDKLPVLDCLTSKTVLFEVNGKIYAGYYHYNNHFYCCEKSDDAVNMAIPDNGKLGIESKYYPVVTKWAYLRESI